jgi:hypothetical protein
MKKSNYVTIGLFCFLALVCITAKAQKETKNFSVGFGLEGGLPTGDANQAYHFTGGVTIRLSYHAGPGFVTLTSGVVGFLPKTGQGDATKASLQIPIKAGYKYIFHKPFFIMGEVGYSSFKVYYKDVNGDLASTTSGGFTYAPSIGVNFNAFEAAIKYEATSLSGGTVSEVALRLGFNF